MSVFHQNILAGASGAAGGAGEALYVDDVFSTFLYTGTDATHTITNGIDLDGEGGLVWIKGRSNAFDHRLFDTERGASKYLSTNDTDAEAEDTVSHTGFNSDGFTLGTRTATNGLNLSFCSWTFRKAPGFFDVVTWTTTSGSAQQISHNLGSTPGMIIVKRTDATSNWIIWHRSLSNSLNDFLRFDNNEKQSAVGVWGSNAPNSTHFEHDGGASGRTFVAYLFGHDDQSFGTNSDEAIIKCGTYTGTGTSSSSVGPDIDLGFEPQWLLVKRSTGSGGNWIMEDTMRGFNDTQRKSFYANGSFAEFNFDDPGLAPTSTGFRVLGDNSQTSKSGISYVYIAIRRPHKPPEAGTDVFTADASGLNAQAGQKTFDADHYVDLVFHKHKTVTSQGFQWFDRLRGGGQILKSNNSNAELSQSSVQFFDIQDGVKAKDSGGNFGNYVGFMFKRAPGFFDIVAYTGTGSARTESHGLAATPELIIVKTRSHVANWYAYVEALGNQAYLVPNKSEGASTGMSIWNSTSPTSSVFSLAGSGWNVNESGKTYIAYLFATLAGISKVGSYSGTGNNVDVNCGFTAGARFVLIKRTDGAAVSGNGDWYVWNSSSGINSGNDPYLILNETDTEADSYDYIDPLNSGFTVTSSAPAALNASGGTYIFLAIA